MGKVLSARDQASNFSLSSSATNVLTMTTPLFWKSLELSNKFFGLVLRYSPPLSWKPSKEQAVVKRTKRALIPFFIYLLLMTFVLFFASNALYMGLQARSCSLKNSVLVSETFQVGIITPCIALILVLYPNLNSFVEQYFNSLLQYERFVHKRSQFGVSQSSVLAIVKAGR